MRITLPSPAATSGSSGGAGTNTLFRFFPRDAEPPASAFSTADTRNSHPVLDFDETTAETVCFRTYIPNGATFAASGTALTINIDAMATSATTGVIGWSVSLERLSPGGQDLDSDGFGTAQTGGNTVDATSGRFVRVPVVFTLAQLPSGLAVGDMLRIRIQRNTSVGSDHANDAELIGVFGDMTPASGA